MVQCYVNAIHAGVQVNTRLMVMWERTAMLESVNVFTSWLVYPENDNRSLPAKNRQQYGRTKIESVEPYLVI